LHQINSTRINNQPTTPVTQVVTLDKTGHHGPLRGVLYNATFHVAVSVDEGGTVCVWCMQDGAREGRFSNAHGDSKVGDVGAAAASFLGARRGTGLQLNI
jgi:hypothetical protein